MALGVLIALAACLATGRLPAAVRGQTPGNRVPYPAQLTLAPGDSVTLYDASLAAAAPSRPDTDTMLFSAEITVANTMPNPLTVSADGKTLTLSGAPGWPLYIRQSLVLPPDSFAGSNLIATLPDGALKVVKQSGYAPQLCSPTDNTATGVTCFIQQDVRDGAGHGFVTVSSSVDGAFSGSLAPAESLSLIYPSPATAMAQLLRFENNTRESMATAWDGTTLQLSIAGGYILDGAASVGSGSSNIHPLSDLGCSSPDGPNTMVCSPGVVPLLSLYLQALLQLPQQAIVLPDTEGGGTLTLTPTSPDATLGGEVVAADWQRQSGDWRGSGVLRPWEDSGDVQLAMSFTDPSPLLLVGYLHDAAGQFSGLGYTLDTSASPVEGRWHAGNPVRADANSRVKLFSDVAVDIVVPSSDSGFGGEVARQPADDSGGLFGVLLGDGIVRAGTAGADSLLQASFDTPQGPATSEAAYTFDFGDGSPDGVVDAAGIFRAGGPPGKYSQVVHHTYAQPGVYTVIVYRDDTTGVRTFGAAKIRIAPAGS